MKPAVLVASSLFVFGCAHHAQVRKEGDVPSAASSAQIASAGPGLPGASGSRSCSADLDCGARQLCIRGQCVDITPELAECSAFRVHFAFDQATVRPEDQPGLQRIARCLKADQALHVTIEGNADERGTDEYNMALADQRATAVARDLGHLGASQAQLNTVSYGKERPLCVEHDEACWAKNRRAAVTASGGR